MITICVSCSNCIECIETGKQCVSCSNCIDCIKREDMDETQNNILAGFKQWMAIKHGNKENG